MLKKSIAILLSLSILFCFCACTQTPEDTTTTDATSESQVETTQSSNAAPDIYIDNNVDVENKIDNDYQTTTKKNTNKNTQTYTQKQTTKKLTTTKKQTTSTHQTKHSHSFSSANCTTPKTCYCGATSGSALGHSYSSATCFSPKTCSRCGATSGSALGHNYKNNKCTRCGKTDPNSLPTNLNAVAVIDEDSYFPNETITNTYGKKYTNAHSFWGGSSYAIFNLDSKYSNFSGEITLANTVASNHNSVVNIYADGVNIYTNSNISRLTDTIPFKVSVNSVKLLKIEVINDSEWSHLERCSIVNAQLTK